MSPAIMTTSAGGRAAFSGQDTLADSSLRIELRI